MAKAKRSKKIGRCSHKCAGKGKRARKKCIKVCMRKKG